MAATAHTGDEAGEDIDAVEIEPAVGACQGGGADLDHHAGTLRQAFRAFLSVV